MKTKDLIEHLQKIENEHPGTDIQFFGAFHESQDLLAKIQDNVYNNQFFSDKNALGRRWV